MRRITMPPTPWDYAPPPMPIERVEVVPAPPHVRRLILDTFEGAIDKRDMAYMARALLQMSDEIFELKERMRATELAIKAQLASGKGDVIG